MYKKIINNVYPIFFSEIRKQQFERFTFIIAIIVFIVNILFITMVNSGLISEYVSGYAGVKLNILSAIYTPFSIILFYEVYLLIYYLPKSTTIYLGKQYEVVALILIRKIFDELARLPIGNEAFSMSNMALLLFVFVGLIIILLLIFWYYKLTDLTKLRDEDIEDGEKKKSFVLLKKALAISLIVIFIFFMLIDFFKFADFQSLSVNNVVYVLKKMSNALFNSFFTALILIEVLLLLFTFNLSDTFSKIIRNSGFAISTILLKLSFRTEGLTNVTIILVAILFGIAILWVYKLFKLKLKHPE